MTSGEDHRRPCPYVGFLIALRDNGLSKLDRFHERIPNLLSNRLRLNHLDAAGASVAIRNPLAVWNDKHAASQPPIGIEEDLVSELIQQVWIGQVSAGGHGGSGAERAEEEYIEAPFLQLVMVRLWEEEMRAGSNALRRETLDRLKGAREIVRTHLDDVMSRLDATSQAVCASFFDRLVTPTGSKVACGGEDLALEAVETTASFGMSPTLAASFRLPPTAPAEDALRQAIQASRLEWSLQMGTMVSDIAFSPDGRKLATASEDKTVNIYHFLVLLLFVSYHCN